MTIRVGGERGSATIWTAATLLLICAVASGTLLWAGAIGARHAADRAADEAALAAAGSALARLYRGADPDPDPVSGPVPGAADNAAQPGWTHGGPCERAAIAATSAGASLLSCGCVGLDCRVSVARSLPVGWLFGRLLSGDRVVALSQAGPSAQEAAAAVDRENRTGPAIPIGPSAPPGIRVVRGVGPVDRAMRSDGRTVRRRGGGPP